ncbi:MAG: PDZ domain-containing protein [Chloroflexota bacterium]
MGKQTIQRFSVLVLALLVAVSAWGVVGAQDNTTTSQPFLGIGLKAADTGVQVTDVAPDSPASTAGVKVDDIITAINDKAVTADTIRETLAGFKVGDEIHLSVQRGDQTLQLNATLIERPAPQASQAPQGQPDSQRPMLGVQLEDTDQGVTIREVVSGSPAEKAGLKVNDIITKIGDKDIKTASDAADAVQAQKVGDKITIEVKRGTETQTVDATLEASSVPMVQTIPFGRGNRGMGIEYDANAQTWTIRNLNQNSPLYTAGLREGDVIQKFDGKAYDPSGLHDYLSGLKADAEVKVTVERDSKAQDISVPVSALNEVSAFGFGNGQFQFFGPNGQPFQMPFNMGQAFGGGRLGVQFVTLDAQAAKEHNVTLTDGALVTQVVDKSPAAEAGLKVNDIITAVDGDKVDAERTLRDRLVAYEPGDKITLDVTRGTDTIKIDVTLGQPEMSDMMPFFGQNGQGFQFPFDQGQGQQQQQQPLPTQGNM